MTQQISKLILPTKEVQSEELKAEIHKKINEADGSVKVMGHRILVALPMVDKIGSIVLPDESRDEGKWQGATGLVLQCGPRAFKDRETWQFDGQRVNVGDWVFFRPSDGLLTEINGQPLLKLIAEIDVKGMAHITGGGLVDNVPRVLPQNVQAVLHRDSWQMPELFRWLQMKGGVADAEMVRVFNCGIGMVVIVSPEQAEQAIASLNAQGLKAWTVGDVVERPQDAPQTIVI